MFGHDSLPTKIYVYKVDKPLEGMEEIRDQIHKAHVYRNQLVEIERRRRDQVDQALRVYSPELADIETRLAELKILLDDLDTAIKKQNTLKRKRAGADPVQKAQQAAYRTERTTLWNRRKELRADFFAEGSPLKADLDTIDVGDLAARKAARAASGLYWGTYLRVEQSMKDCRKGAPPDFRRWTGEGSLAVQLQGGLDWTAARLCNDLRFRIEVRPPSPLADPDSARSRHKPPAVFWFRVGSGKKGVPLWAKFRTRLYRQPPAGTKIKWVWLHVDKVGYREVWRLLIVLSREEDWERPGDAAAGGIAGLDVGWRMVGGDLRVAYALGDDDHKMILTIPADRLSAWSKADSLQSIRDRNLDEIKALLAEWLAERGDDLPGWLTEDASHLAQWKSKSRLVRLARYWRDNRFAGDEAIYTSLDAWQKQEQHLRNWEAAQRLKAVRRRDDEYRKFAARLARRYHTIRVEDIDWRELKKRTPPEKKSDQPNELEEKRRRSASIAAVGQLTRFIREAAAEVQDIEPEYTTKACHACGTIEEWDAERELEHTCGNCGVRWDQDFNAAVWLLLGGVQPAPVEQ